MVSQIEATRSRHVSQSGSSVFSLVYLLLFLFFYYCCYCVVCRLLTVQMTWMAPSSWMLRRKKRENDVALSHSPQTRLVLSLTPPSFVILFTFFVVLSQSYFMVLCCFILLTGDVAFRLHRAPSFLIVKRNERATWRSLIHSLKRICGELIAAGSLLFCHFSHLLFCRFFCCFLSFSL